MAGHSVLKEWRGQESLLDLQHQSLSVSTVRQICFGSRHVPLARQMMAHRVIAGQLCSIDNCIPPNVGRDALPKAEDALFPARSQLDFDRPLSESLTGRAVIATPSSAFRLQDLILEATGSCT